MRKTLLPLALLALAASSQAVSLAVWNFNDSSTPTQADLFSVDRTATSIASATMSTTFPSTALAIGTTIGRDGSDTAVRALVLPSGATSSTLNNGKSLTFSLTKKAGFALSKVKIGFAGRSNTGGFNDNQLAYSTNGTTFTDFATYGPLLTADYAVQSFDLSGVSALNAATTLTFRITFMGATAASGTTGNAIDNLIVSGDVQAVPEPAPLAALGLGAVAILRRRKRV